METRPEIGAVVHETATALTPPSIGQNTLCTAYLSRVSDRFEGVFKEFRA
ncbi:hypothetical protein SAV14893_079980 [Streptomyces avermitilis]|uniref:Uncharacterized protein n=1 Tax=Streptomyces avermitilis TaxID=33903 RepID=A0A4D4M9R9_STRAX|nr:hypothetical protein SAV14893_079980 [Streptomyces avermitilis]GDY71020.1 hypothetical protein SAV31267_005050 [Streptomyces avermitilis]